MRERERERRDDWARIVFLEDDLAPSALIIIMKTVKRCRALPGSSSSSSRQLGQSGVN